MASKDIEVALNGPLFSQNVGAVVQNAIVAEALTKVEERMERSARVRVSKGRRLVGNPRNRISQRLQGPTLEIASTLIPPRTRGTAWVRKHLGTPGYGKGIIGAMLPNVLRKLGRRIAEELGD